MNDYRKTHPGYAKQNRIQQKQRNQKRQKTNKAEMSGKIVKSDAFKPEVEKTDIYLMKILTPNVAEKIVKSDALIVQIQKYQATKSN